MQILKVMNLFPLCLFLLVGNKQGFTLNIEREKDKMRVREKENISKRVSKRERER